MTKAELVSKNSLKTGIEKLTALAVVESMMNEIKDSISENEAVFLRGFGTFKPKKRAKKTGRNIKKNTTNVFLFLCVIMRIYIFLYTSTYDVLLV